MQNCKRLLLLGVAVVPSFETPSLAGRFLRMTSIAVGEARKHTPAVILRAARASLREPRRMGRTRGIEPWTR